MSGFTVAVTYHNEKDLLRRCLESLLSGTRLPSEILVYDDASRFPAEHFIPASSVIRVIRGESNVGPSRGRNHLLSEASGNWIHFHDADDWFEPRWMECVWGEFETTDAEMVFTEVKSFRSGQLDVDKVVGWSEIANQDLVEFSLRHFIMPASASYRKSFLVEAGGYPLIRQSEDYALHLELALRSRRYRVLPESLVCLDNREGGRSRSRALEPWQDSLEILRSFAPRFSQRYHPPLAEAAARVAARLYELGDKRAAEGAYALAAQYGPPRYEGRGVLYRVIARSLGPLAAERVGGVYRSLLPSGVRRRLR